MQSANTKESAIELRERKTGIRAGRAKAKAIPLIKSRLTDADLEEFRRDIIRFNKQKQYKVLAISALIFIAIGTAWLMWLY